MGIILDIIIVLIILLCAILSAKRGFTRTLVGLIGYIIAIFVALFISGYLSNLIYNEFIEPNLIIYVSNSLKDIANNVIESVPDFILRISDFAGYSKGYLESVAISEVDSSAVSIVSGVEPYLLNALRTFLTMLFFAILSFIFKILAKQINFTVSKSIFGKANTFLGAVLGVIKGLIFSVLFCLIVSFVVSTGVLGVDIINVNMINSSYICKFLLDFCLVTL